MRVAALLLWAIAIVTMILPFLRRTALSDGPPPALRDELVKDPVCQTYIVRSRAVSRGAVDFCSAECASRYAGG